MTTTGPRTFETHDIRSGPITNMLRRVRAWLDASADQRARRSERPHDGWNR